MSTSNPFYIPYWIFRASDNPDATEYHIVAIKNEDFELFKIHFLGFLQSWDSVPKEGYWGCPKEYSHNDHMIGCITRKYIDQLDTIREKWFMIKLKQLKDDKDRGNIGGR